jgi:Fe-S-cluster containining protein
MCCNGTLFNYVTLVPDDLPKLEKYPQLNLKIRSEQATFDEPCVLHTGKGCSAYDDRPATCERYVCGVLRSVAKEELTEDEALLLIKEGRALVEVVKEYIAFEPGMPIAVSTWDAAPEDISEDARFAWDRTAYHMGKHFLNTVKEEVEPSPRSAHPSGSPAFAEPLPERVRASRASLFAAVATRQSPKAPRIP